jgi:two-component system phosphate regulon sensor histidine kinase PhoR
MARRSLFWQLFPSFGLVVLLSVVAVAWFIIHSLKDFHLTRTEKDLEARALLIKSQLVGFSLETDAVRIDTLCKQLGRQTATRITVVLVSGKVIADSDEDPARMENHANRAEIAQAFAGQFGVATRYSHTLFKTMMYAASPITEHDRVVGVVRTSLPISDVEHAFGSVYAHVFTGVLLIAILAAIVSYIISRRVSRPLVRMKQAAEHFTRGDFLHRLPLGTTAEIDELAQTMNRMAAQLDDQIRTVIEQKSERDAVLSSMVEGVIAIDKSERIISVNRAAAEMLDIDASEVRGRYVQEAFRIADLQKFIARTLKAVAAQEGEFALGERPERIVQAHGAPLQTVDGRSMGAVIVLHDITRLHQLEIVRRDFVANVSHELRTPVTSIKGFVETLREGAISNPDDAFRFLEIIARQTDRLNSIISDLLTLSQLEQTERGRIGLEPTDIKTLLEESVEICRPKANVHNIELAVQCDESINLQVNPSLMEQAVVNLVGNAIKYSNAGGVVEIRAETGASGVMISVADHGCGIERVHLPRLFERFYRVDQARSRELGGTGLGLAIVKHIVSAHHGTVGVESTPGKGSKFTITLPSGRKDVG